MRKTDRRWIAQRNGAPFDPRTGRAPKPYAPENWKTFEEVENEPEKGYVITKDDGLFFLDLDDCRDPVTGEWSSFAVDIFKRFPKDVFRQISFSGTGAHIVGRATLLEGYKKKLPHIELYSEKIVRYGSAQHGHVDVDCTEIVQQIQRDIMGESILAARDLGGIPEYQIPEDAAALTATDEELLNAAFASKSSFSNSMFTFRELYEGDIPEEYKITQQSELDQSLLCHLAFWTAQDVDRMIRLFERSARGEREKCASRPDYMRMSAVKAAATVSQYWKRSKPKQSEADPMAGTLSEAEMRNLFDGCIFISNLNRVYMPNFEFYTPDQFKNHFSNYKFIVDANDNPSKDAFEAFVKNRLFSFPKVNGVVFKPGLPHGVMVDDAVNIFSEKFVGERAQGTPTLFLDFMSRILPDQHDRNVLLYYMAAMVQHRGVKFQWAPFIQGVQGNGKTFILELMKFCQGVKYSHTVNASELANSATRFNGWFENKLFIAVDEIYVADRVEVMHALKPYITNVHIEIQNKGVDQRMVESCANFILCSNDKAAIIIKRDDRRYAPLFTAQQRESHKLRDGLTEAYFSKLWNIDMAVVHDYLAKLEIPDNYNPAVGAHVRPVTSSLAEAVRLGIGPLGQDVLERIESNEAGFRGGYVTSKTLLRLKPGIKIPTWESVMEEIGYTYPDVLNDGRARFDIPGEDRPKIWCAANLATDPNPETSYTRANL